MTAEFVFQSVHESKVAQHAANLAVALAEDKINAAFVVGLTACVVAEQRQFLDAVLFGNRCDIAAYLVNRLNHLFRRPKVVAYRVHELYVDETQSQATDKFLRRLKFFAEFAKICAGGVFYDTQKIDHSGQREYCRKLR